MPSYKFSVAEPCRMDWSDHVGGCGNCPECGAGLESENHSYVVATRSAGQTTPFMTGNDAGHFCGRCPLVILDRHRFEDCLWAMVGDVRDVQYAVLGLVDLDAVPEQKRHMPFDEKTNPIPLVEFANLDEPGPADRSPAAGRRLKWRKQRKRKSR
jgi:hypothetical protein